jgi:primosomal protein N'
MAQETLRGSSLGSRSFESETNVNYAERLTLVYHCHNNHETAVVFAGDAEIPEVWQCRICSADATVVSPDSPAPEASRPGRSHWEMLLERRSIAELEEILNEQLLQLRQRRARGQVDF